MISRNVSLVMLVLACLAVGGVGAACGSSNDTSSGGDSNPTGPVTVAARNGAMGMYLTAGQGRSLYLFVADTNGTSTCTGPCAAEWPPLLTTGAPQAGSGVTADMLSTVARADGTKQVTYNKHPLYLFGGDKAAGDTTGQGVNAFGALWWLVTPTGNAITTTSSPSAGY
jgi:predicted lipoprotein with Yx(FWY)xxD motif